MMNRENVTTQADGKEREKYEKKKRIYTHSLFSIFSAPEMVSDHEHVSYIMKMEGTEMKFIKPIKNNESNFYRLMNGWKNSHKNSLCVRACV